MWWGEEISQPALPPAPDPSRSQRHTLRATRAHAHTSATLSLAFTHLHTQTSVPLPCLGEARRVHSLRKGASFLFPVDTSQATQVYCPKPPRVPGLAKSLESSSRCQERVPADLAWGVGLCWASSSRPGVVRGLSQVGSLGAAVG